ncbi:MAG: type 1 glutamine amidotransferase [Nitrospinota bacterium]
MSVLAVQHVGCEPMGLLEEILKEYRIDYHYVHPYRGEPIPQSHRGIDCLVLMGGPMNVYQHTAYPFLLEEDVLIRNCLEEKVPILGICLGSQLLAKASDAQVRRGRVKEIGWRPIRLTPEAQADPVFAGMEEDFPVFHWHGDTFDLPEGAVLLAASDTYPHQAYRLGYNAYAFQFHVEVTEPMIRQWCAEYPDDLRTLDAAPDDPPVYEGCRMLIGPLHERARRIFLSYFRHVHLI